MSKIAIMVDSSADLSPEKAAELGIHVLRMPVVIDDVSYIEQDEISIEELSNALTTGRKVTTTQASPRRIEEVWDETLKSYDQIVFMPISTKLSGSNATAMSLASTDKYKGKVIVIESRYVAYAMTHLACDIKALVDQGVDVLEIKERVESTVNQDAFIVPYDLNTFKNSGRVKPAVAALAGLLKIQVVLQFDHEGKIEQIDKVRTLSKAYQVMLKHAMNIENPQDYHWGVVHSDIEDEASKIKLELENTMHVPVELVRIRSVIRCHTGNKTIAIYRINKLK